VWADYRKEGDGTFTIAGLQARFVKAGLEVAVEAAPTEWALVVTTGDQRWGVPSFCHACHKMSDWFESPPAARNALAETLIRAALLDAASGVVIERGSITP
jgi:hypothetical protein